MAGTQVALSRTGLRMAGEQDSPDIYEFPYGDNKIVAQRYDPYGFWRITLGRGATPKDLQGDFSNQLYAERAIKAFLDKQKAQ